MLNEACIKLQSILSYLSAIRDKHEQLGFLEWGRQIRFHTTITWMLRSIRRNHVHTRMERANPISERHLRLLSSRLNHENPQHTLFWAIATVAFYSMARLGELLPADNSKMTLAMRLKHLTIGRDKNGPHVLITLPMSKMYDPAIEATLAIWEVESGICPWTALEKYLKFQLAKGYGKDSDTLWYIENGHAINKQWFLEVLAHFLPEHTFTEHSFCAGSVIH